MIGGAIRRIINPARRLYGRFAIGGGQFRRARPLSREYGFDRGTPIDRYYVEAFLDSNATAIRGRVLEVGDDTYSRRFGGDRVARQDVLHVQHNHPKATIVGNLSDPRTLPSGAFDCIILTQTLHLIYEVEAAARELRRALARGGTVLITVPGVSSIDRGEWGASWYWSLTELSLKRLLSPHFDSASISVQTFGNLFAATAFLHGASVEEVDRAKLHAIDQAFPVIIAASARAH
jgi:SAM-dependent methyltransferase